MEIITIDLLNNSGSLIQQRPPNYALYKEINTGSKEAIIRKRFCFATEYAQTGVLRETPGAIIYIGNQYFSICPTVSGYYDLVPVEDPKDFGLVNDVPWSIPQLLPNGLYICRPGINNEFLTLNYF
jgi:hypothetical protein